MEDLKGSRNHFGFREVLKDSFYYLPAKAIPAVMGFIAVAAYTRLLTPREYGQYILVLTTISMVSLFAFGWLNQSILRYFEENRKRDSFGQFITTNIIFWLTLLLVISFIWYLLTVVLHDYLGSNLGHLLRIGVLVLGVQTGYSLVLTMLRADRQALKYSLFSSADAIGRLGLAILLIHYLSLKADGILWGVAAATGGVFLWGFVSLYRRWRIKIVPPSMALLKKYALYGLPLAAVGAGELILSVSDRYMIGYFLGAGKVGIYAAGYNIVSVAMGSIFTVLFLAAYPILIQAYEHEGEDKVRTLLKDILAIYFLALIPILFGIVALSRDIVTVVLGKEFMQAEIIIPWVAGGIFFLGLAFCAYNPFYLRKKTQVLLLPLAFASASNIGLNIILIPHLGIVGAAISTFVAYLILFIATFGYSTRLLAWIIPWETFIKTILAGAAMYFVLFFSFHGAVMGFKLIVIKIVCGAVIYIAIAALLKEQLLWRGFKRVIGYIR